MRKLWKDYLEYYHEAMDSALKHWRGIMFITILIYAVYGTYILIWWNWDKITRFFNGLFNRKDAIILEEEGAQ